MSEAVVLALVSALLFVALAHMAVETPHKRFRQATGAMALAGVVVVALSPAAGVALLGPVLLSRRLSDTPYVPETVNDLLDRYQ